MRDLFEQKRWAEVIEAAKALPQNEADTAYYYGVSLAQLGTLNQARTVLLAGHRLRPKDSRFLTELGGVAFKQNQYAEAASWLRAALRFDPKDAYTIEFLATIYYLRGNLDAALHYWNQIAKPQIVNIRTPPMLHLDPVLLDRAFTFAPASTLTLSELQTTRVRIRELGVFPAFNFLLDARQDGKFDGTFTARERNGFGQTKMEAAVSTLRGVGFQTVYPEYFNITGSAVNFTSLVRWDAQKRRLQATLSGPFRNDPKRRYWLGLDLRDEYWDLNRPFGEMSAAFGQFKLRKNALSGGIASFPSANWNWSASGELSHREFLSVSAPPSSLNQTLLTGYQLKQITKLNRELLRVPQRRFESNMNLSAETGTIWAEPTKTFERLQGSVFAHWNPKMTGDDYAMQARVGAGRFFGQAPFDELFLLGIERDNDLWLRAHVGTRDGRKGSAPLGRQYFLSNFEMDKVVYTNGLLSVKLSPFLDSGKMDSSIRPGSGKWLWDTGVQAKLQVLGIGFAFVYGKDLRSGNNAYYFTATR